MHVDEQLSSPTLNNSFKRETPWFSEGRGKNKKEKKNLKLQNQ